jgi:hypothetical protein
MIPATRPNVEEMKQPREQTPLRIHLTFGDNAYRVSQITKRRSVGNYSVMFHDRTTTCRGWFAFALVASDVCPDVMARARDTAALMQERDKEVRL